MNNATPSLILLTIFQTENGVFSSPRSSKNDEKPNRHYVTSRHKNTMTAKYAVICRLFHEVKMKQRSARSGLNRYQAGLSQPDVAGSMIVLLTVPESQDKRPALGMGARCLLRQYAAGHPASGYPGRVQNGSPQTEHGHRHAHHPKFQIVVLRMTHRRLECMRDPADPK